MSVLRANFAVIRKFKVILFTSTEKIRLAQTRINFWRHVSRNTQFYRFTYCKLVATEMLETYLI